MSKLNYKKETSAGGIVYKHDGGQVLWLITQHSLHKGWSFPKGIIGDTVDNEPKEEAALREVEEEGGIKAKIMNPTPVEVKYKYRMDDTLVDKNVFYFLMEYQSGDPANHDWEVTEAKFVSEDEVKTTLTFEADKEAFAKMIRFQKTS